MKCILHENQSPLQGIRHEARGKNEFKGNQNGQLPKKQLPEEIEESEQKELGRTALLGGEISLKGHGQPEEGQMILEGVSSSVG